jgi:hypothetical protein
VFAHYQALIRLRHELPILVDGDFTPLMAEDPTIWAYTRTTPNSRLLVIANCGRDPRTVELGPEWIDADLLLGNLSDAPMTSVSSLDLAGWDARIYSAQADARQCCRPRHGNSERGDTTTASLTPYGVTSQTPVQLHGQVNPDGSALGTDSAGAKWRAAGS